MAFDYKKAYREFYMPERTPSVVTVPGMNFIAVRGHGDPNAEDGAYRQSVGLLYGIAFTIKMSKKSDHRILLRRLGVCACDVTSDEGMYQMDLFTDFEALDKEKRLHAALLEVRTRYGANALLKGISLLEGATTRMRNEQIGGHRA